MSRTEWVIANCRLLEATGADLARTLPFAGLRIGTAIHVEPKTVALLLTLQRGGGIETLHLGDARTVHVLTEGHMVNLAGPRPLGNSIESMDLGFTLQARCLEAVARGDVDAASCVVPVPRAIDERVAAAYVDLVAA